MPTAAVVVRDEGVGGLFDLDILSIEALWEDAHIPAGILWCKGVGRSVEAVLS
jgi:hypothetical protein